MKLGILFSGGKDSFLAMLKMMKEHEIACLISVISANRESYMFHVPGIEFVDYSAKAVDLSLIKQETKGEKEKELKDLENAIKKAVEKHKIDGIVSGAIASNYQASRIQKICDKLGVKCFNPLWQKNQINALNEIVEKKIKVIITGVACYPLNESWLGRMIDKKFIKDVLLLEKKYKINPAGEGGEFETMVIDSPVHKYSLKIVEAKKIFSKNYGFYEIKKVELEKH